MLEIRCSGMRPESRNLVIDKDWPGNMRFSSRALNLIVGCNGSGKTLILEKIAGYSRLRWSGDVEYIGSISAYKSAVYMPQQISDVDDLSIANLASLVPRRQRSKVLGESDFPHRDLGSLSGGERQRAIFYFLAGLQRTVFFLDEPLQFLSSQWKERVAETIVSKVERGCLVVVVTHDEGIYRSLGRRVSVVNLG